MFLLVKIVLKILTRKKLCALRLMTTICIYMLRTNVATYLINNFRIYTALHYQNSLKKITRPPTQMPPPLQKIKQFCTISLCLSIQCIVIPYFIYLNYFQKAYVDVDGNDIIELFVIEIFQNNGINLMKMCRKR